MHCPCNRPNTSQCPKQNNQFNKLRQCWSNHLKCSFQESQNMGPSNWQQVSENPPLCPCAKPRVKGKFGVAYLVEKNDFCKKPKPCGWQIEFNDTPSKVEYNCKKMVNWVTCPPVGECQNNDTTVCCCHKEQPKICYCPQKQQECCCSTLQSNLCCCQTHKKEEMQTCNCHEKQCCSASKNTTEPCSCKKDTIKCCCQRKKERNEFCCCQKEKEKTCCCCEPEKGRKKYFESTKRCVICCCKISDKRKDKHCCLCSKKITKKDKPCCHCCSASSLEKSESDTDQCSCERRCVKNRDKREKDKTKERNRREGEHHHKPSKKKESKKHKSDEGDTEEEIEPEPKKKQNKRPKNHLGIKPHEDKKSDFFQELTEKTKNIYESGIKLKNTSNDIVQKRNEAQNLKADEGNKLSNDNTKNEETPEMHLKNKSDEFEKHYNNGRKSPTQIESTSQNNESIKNEEGTFHLKNNSVAQSQTEEQSPKNDIKKEKYVVEPKNKSEKEESLVLTTDYVNSNIEEADNISDKNVEVQKKMSESKADEINAPLMSIAPQKPPKETENSLLKKIRKEHKKEMDIIHQEEIENHQPPAEN